MAVDVTRARTQVSRNVWDELVIPEAYRAEVVDDRLVVTPRRPDHVEPLTVEEWERVLVPESYRAEVVRSELVVSPPAALPHGRLQGGLVLFLHPRLPDGYEVLLNMEWRHEADGLVTDAPQPDVVVTPAGIDRITEPPLLAVEVRSPSDAQQLTGSPLTRLDAKRHDYGAHGLADYLEVALDDGTPVATRYENRDGVLVEVDRAVGDEVLVAARPFAYELVPARLLDR